MLSALCMLRACALHAELHEDLLCYQLASCVPGFFVRVHASCRVTET